MADISTSRQRELMGQLATLCRERARLEAEIEETYATSTRRTKEEFDQRDRAHAAAHQDEIDQLQAKLNARLETARHTFEATTTQARANHELAVGQAEAHHQQGITSAEEARRDAVGSAENNFLQDMTLATDVSNQAQATVDNCRQQLDWLLEESAALLKRRGRQLQLQPPDPATTQHSTAQLLSRYGGHAQQINEKLVQIKQRLTVRFVDEGWPILLAIASAALGGGVAGFAMGTSVAIALGVAAGTALVVGAGSRFVMQSVAKRQTAEPLHELTTQLNECARTVAHAEEMVKLEKSERERELTFRRDQQLDQAEAAWKKTETALNAELETVTRNAESGLRLQEQQAQKSWDDTATETRTKFLTMIHERKDTFES
ncbi:MAG: hypothetical protein AAGF97_02270, partial [Planctomycetota bacterium]